MTEHVDLSDTERQALADLSHEEAPPPAVEAQVVAALRARGLIRSTPPRLQVLRWLAAAAVLVAAFGSGVTWARLSAARAATVGPRYLLLLYGGDVAAESATRRDEYAAWARSPDRKGAVLTGEELTGMTTPLPAASAFPGGWPEPPAGFFIVSAATMEGAQAVAATCPHLQHGGRIVVRAIASGPGTPH